MSKRFAICLLLIACGHAGELDATDAATRDAGEGWDDPTETSHPLDAGAWTDVADAGELDAHDDAPPPCGPPTPFGQLACFGHPDAGRAGTSHGDGCDPGDAGDCYELQPHLWCCPQ